MIWAIIGWILAVVTFLSLVANFIQYFLYKSDVGDWKELASNRGARVIELEAHYKNHELLIKENKKFHNDREAIRMIVGPSPHLEN